MKESLANRKLIIVKLKDKIVTCLWEDNRVTELHCMDEEDGAGFRIGSIYVGKVKNIVPSIQAAFIEIAPGVECYYDIKKNESPMFTNKIGKKPLCIGDELLVQIEKEAVKTKAMTVTGKISFPGKYAVLVHGEEAIGVSSKIQKKAREEIRNSLADASLENYGYIVRTNAQEADTDVLRRELERLRVEYEELLMIADKRTAYSCLKAAPKPYIAELRNIRQEGLESILIEDASVYEEAQRYMEVEQPEDIGKLVHYQDEKFPLHKLYGVEAVIDSALKERVWMKSGAYLVIQYTEAMTVIDVNTGKAVKKKQDAGFYSKINIEAAKEAARQIRLRNLSGIILIDFINMEDRESAEALMCFLRTELSKDPVPATLVDMTALYLIEITRKKVRKPFHESFS